MMKLFERIKLFLLGFLGIFADLYHDQRAISFDLMGLLFMVVAIYVGNMLGPMLGSFLGSMGAGLVGAFIAGLVIYGIFTLITGGKMTIMGAVIFSICVYASVLITGMVTGYAGMVTGWVALIVQAIILSLIYSLIAPKGETTTQLPAQV